MGRWPCSGRESAACSIGGGTRSTKGRRNEGTEGACGGGRDCGDRRCWPSGGARAPARRRPPIKHYVGCGISRNAKPAHVCPKGSKKGAFFKSLKADVVYSVCVKFPSGKNLCAQKQEATKGTLYVNKVTSTIPGKHQVTWFVEGKKVGTFVFLVKD